MKFTECITCHKDIQYTTRKPKLCASCKLNAKPVKKRRGGRFPKNKGTNAELIMFSLIDQLSLGSYFVNHGYYSFLLSPKQAPMQLDRFYPEIMLAFEYDGHQHDTYVKFIHKNIKNFEYYQECDRLKDKLCKKAGVTLARISYKDKLTVENVIHAIHKADPLHLQRLIQEKRIKGV